MEKPVPEDFGVTEEKVLKYKRRHKHLFLYFFLPIFICSSVIIFFYDFNDPNLKTGELAHAITVSLIIGFFIYCASLLLFGFGVIVKMIFSKLTQKVMDNGRISDYLIALKKYKNEQDRAEWEEEKEE